jgi:hypothetical protein
MAELSRVRSREQIPGIVDLASAIWTDHYVPLIGQKQVDYMLAKFQSEEAIKTQLSEGYEYYIVSHNGQRAGYMAIVPDEDAGKILRDRPSIGAGGWAQGDFSDSGCVPKTLKTLKALAIVYRAGTWQPDQFYKACNQSVGDAVYRDVFSSLFASRSNKIRYVVG